MWRNFRIFNVIIGLLTIMLIPSISFSEDLEGDMQKAFEKCRIIVIKMEQKLQREETLESELASFAKINESIKAMDMLLQSSYNNRLNFDILSKDSKFINRHLAMQIRYSGYISEYFKLTETLIDEASVTLKVLSDLREFLEKKKLKKKWPVYGTLPYRHVNFSAKLPVYTPIVIPEYLGGGIAETEDDLSSSTSAPVSKEIAEFAKNLNWNPVTIYEWVKNNVKTEWYWGCMKGAEETLRQKSGNDCDQAALLVALLRSSGFRSRFVKGVIKFFPDIETAKNLTGLDNNNELAAFFQKVGIPYSPVVTGGKISNFEFEHIWVESEIPYSNYRGGVIDESGKTWIGIDTSIKIAKSDVKKGEPLPEGFDLHTINANYLSKKRNETLVDYLKMSITKFLSDNDSELEYDDLLTKRSLSPEVLNIIPASPQFEIVAINGEYTSLPENLFHKITFKATSLDGLNEFFTTTTVTPALSNRMITLSYEPETVEDLEIINSFGGLDNTPAYLVRLRPVIRIDGKNIIVGRDGLPMGSDYLFTMTINSPSGDEQINNIHTIGNIAVIGIVSQNAVFPDLVAEDKNTIERMFYEEALNYINSWNESENELASLYNIIVSRPLPTLVTIGGVPKVTRLLGEPHDMSLTGVYIDADFRAVEIIGESEKRKQFMRLSSLEGSILESRLLHDAFNLHFAHRERKVVNLFFAFFFTISIYVS